MRLYWAENNICLAPGYNLSTHLPERYSMVKEHVFQETCKQMQWTGLSVLNFSSDELFLFKAEQISKVFEGNNLILLSLFLGALKTQRKIKKTCAVSSVMSKTLVTMSLLCCPCLCLTWVKQHDRGHLARHVSAINRLSF